jgi:hypothetical protein
MGTHMATMAIVTVPDVDGELEIPCDMLDVNEETGSLSLFRFDEEMGQFKLWAHFATYTHVYMVDDGEEEDADIKSRRKFALLEEDDEEEEDDEDYDDDEEADEEESSAEDESSVVVPVEASEPPSDGPALNSFSSAVAPGAAAS